MINEALGSRGCIGTPDGLPRIGDANLGWQAHFTSAPPAEWRQAASKEMAMRKWLLAGLFAAMLSGPAAAWWDGGHMQIAYVAYTVAGR